MSVLKNYFNKKTGESLIQDDYERVVNYDEKGDEIVTWKKVDYEAIQKSNGDVSDWSLDALLKAGINPNFPIHTGNATRLEGIDVVNRAAVIADTLITEDTNKNKE